MKKIIVGIFILIIILIYGTSGYMFLEDMSL